LIDGVKIQSRMDALKAKFHVNQRNNNLTMSSS
jgi:hypothetical protein